MTPRLYKQREYQAKDRHGKYKKRDKPSQKGKWPAQSLRRFERRGTVQDFSPVWTGSGPQIAHLQGTYREKCIIEGGEIWEGKTKGWGNPILEHKEGKTKSIWEVEEVSEGGDRDNG